MKKIFLNEKPDKKIVLVGNKHTHLSYVLRSRIGDKVTLCYCNTDYICEIISISKSETLLNVLYTKPCETEPKLDLSLFFAIMKGDKNELVAQKCTELGVKNLFPFISSNCECRVESFKTERINKIITEAAEQCGRGMLPLIDRVLAFDEVLARLKDYDIIVFPYEREKNVSVKTILSKISGKKTAIIIGSEGGFTAEEANLLISADAESVSLGNRILRAETASIAIVAAAMYEGNEWKIT